MGKRIKQTFNNGRVSTFTTGTARGNLPNFDVSIISPANGQHRKTEFDVSTYQSGKRRKFRLNGRQARTVYEVLSRHFNEID